MPRPKTEFRNGWESTDGIETNNCSKVANMADGKQFSYRCTENYSLKKVVYSLVAMNISLLCIAREYF